MATAQKNFINIDGESALVRDKNSKAVLNKDNGEFLALDTLKNIIKQNHKEHQHKISKLFEKFEEFNQIVNMEKPKNEIKDENKISIKSQQAK